MSVFPKTRAAAGYIAGTGPGELARARATKLLARLGACDDILPGSDGDVPAVCGLCVPRTLSTSCDQAVFVEHATNASVSPDVVSLNIDRFG